MQIVSRLLQWRVLAVAAIAVLAAAGGTLARSPIISTAAPTTYTAMAGGTGGAPASFINVFEPSSLIISEGDSVMWKVNGDEPHTVLFLNNQPPPKEINLDTLEDAIGGKSPSYDGTKQIYSGFITPDPKSSYTVKFSKAGSYAFICLIHPGMEGSVTVLSAGLFTPTQAQMDAEGKKVQAAGEAAVAKLLATPVSATRTQTGATSAWTIPASPFAKVPGGFVDQNAFTPARVSIGAGDTVTWMNDTAQAHTITFLGGRTPDQLTADPTMPTTGTKYTGTEFLSSGLIGTAPNVPFFTGGSKFSLTFPTPGVYPYICILHIDQGMAGVIEVGAAGSGGAPAGSAPLTTNVPPGQGTAGVTLRPPATGDAGLLNGTSAAWPLALLVALSGVAALGLMRARARS